MPALLAPLAPMFSYPAFGGGCPDTPEVFVAPRVAAPAPRRPTPALGPQPRPDLGTPAPRPRLEPGHPHPRLQPRLEPGTPADGYSGAAAPGPAVYIGLAAPFEVWTDVHTVRSPHITRGDGLPCRSWTRRGAYTKCLRAVARGEHVVTLNVDHAPDLVLASTRDGSLRFFPRTDGLYFWICGCDLDDYAALRPAVSTNSRPTAGDARPSPDNRCLHVVSDEEWLTEVSLVPSGSFPVPTWWRRVPGVVS